MTVEPGDIYGFLGPNRAGKTTTLRILLGLIRPEDGEARLFGRDPQHELPEAPESPASSRRRTSTRTSAAGRTSSCWPRSISTAAARIVGTLVYALSMEAIAGLVHQPWAQHYLLSDQFDGWHGLFMSPIDWTLIARAAWVSAIFAAVPLALAYGIFKSRDLADD